MYAVLIILLLGMLGSADAAAPERTAAPVFDNTSLNLTPEQKDKIQILREERWNELKPLRNLLFRKFKELKTVLNRSNTDESRIEAMKSEILVLQGKIHEKLAEYRMQLRRILTKEQQNHLRAYGLERGYFRPTLNPANFNEKKTGDARHP